jgi:cyclopropane-fatty-acyl-phospholipid synthase
LRAAACRRTIFEGGSLPSNEFIAHAVARQTDMQMVGYEDITQQYPETLRRWRSAFNENFGRNRGLGYDEKFRRLWNLYLAYCEAGFSERRIRVSQTVLAKPSYRDTWDEFATDVRASRQSAAA